MKIIQLYITILACVLPFVAADQDEVLTIVGNYRIFSTVHKCNVNCVQFTTKKRFCRTDRTCKRMRTNLLDIHECVGDFCPKEEKTWTQWKNVKYHNCEKNCLRPITQKRYCTIPTPGIWYECALGDHTRKRHERCYEGSCKKMNGKWTGWLRKPTDVCGVHCTQHVNLIRRCTNPAPAHGGRDCPGKDRQHLVVTCTGDYCVTEEDYIVQTRSTSTTTVSALKMKSSSGLSTTGMIMLGIGFLLLLIFVVAIIYFWRRKQKTKNKTTVREVVVPKPAEEKKGKDIVKINVIKDKDGTTRAGKEATNDSKKPTDAKNKSKDSQKTEASKPSTESNKAQGGNKSASPNAKKT